jgi:hypothetical protein
MFASTMDRGDRVMRSTQLRDVLETIDELGAASVTLVARELSTPIEAARPAWSRALEIQLLRRAGRDELGETACVLTPRGREQLRTLQLAVASTVCLTCGRILGGGACGRCAGSDARPASRRDIFDCSRDERLLAVVAETLAERTALCAAQPRTRIARNRARQAVAALDDRLRRQLELLRSMLDRGRADRDGPDRDVDRRAALALEQVEGWVLGAVTHAVGA